MNKFQKNVIFSAINLILFSCTDNPEELKKTDSIIILTEKISVFKFDGCEYLVYKEDKDSNSSYGFMAHKGNCSNPIHSKIRENEK